MARVVSPRPRDLDIYYAVKAEGQLQVDVAEQYEITQSRVSRIIARVGRWIAEQKPGMGYSVAQQLYLAADIQVEKLRAQERKANEAFEITRTQPANKSGAIRPDPRLLKQAFEVSLSLYQARLTAIGAEEHCRQFLEAAEAMMQELISQQTGEAEAKPIEVERDVSYENGHIAADATELAPTAEAASEAVANTSSEVAALTTTPNRSRKRGHIPANKRNRVAYLQGPLIMPKEARWNRSKREKRDPLPREAELAAA